MTEEKKPQSALSKNHEKPSVEPSDKVPDLGAGDNLLKQSDSEAHLENLNRINDGEPAKVPTPEELEAKREKGEKIRKTYTPEEIGQGVRQELDRKKDQFDKEFTPPSVTDIAKSDPEKEDELTLVNVAKLFLLNDDKMTDYAEELRERCNCTAKHPIVVIEVPGDRDVKLIWRGDSGITVKPCE